MEVASASDKGSTSRKRHRRIAAARSANLHQRTRSLPNCFLQWLRADGQNLLQEITVVRGRHRVDLAFRRFPHTLSGCLHHNTISVAAMRGKVCWDFVCDADVSPRRTSAGWVCTQCPEPQLFETRFDLFRDHLFFAICRLGVRAARSKWKCGVLGFCWHDHGQAAARTGGAAEDRTGARAEYEKARQS